MFKKLVSDITPDLELVDGKIHPTGHINFLVANYENPQNDFIVATVEVEWALTFAEQFSKASMNY